MDIEDLSKAQLLLLSVLVSLVVSIATSVLTVSFLDQVPVKDIRPSDGVMGTAGQDR